MPVKKDIINDLISTKKKMPVRLSGLSGRRKKDIFSSKSRKSLYLERKSRIPIFGKKKTATLARSNGKKRADSSPAGKENQKKDRKLFFPPAKRQTILQLGGEGKNTVHAKGQIKPEANSKQKRLLL